MRVLVVGDPYMPAEVFRAPLEAIAPPVTISYSQIEQTRPAIPRTESEARVREYAGSPDQIIEALGDHDVLVVHGAPVTEEVLDKGNLRLVCCARGGPVNVDVRAATERGIPVVNTPGKNAHAVADLTIAFVLMLLRGIGRSSRHLLDGGPLAESAFEGREFFGTEADGTALGLVGYGNVGRQVAERAAALGIRVLVHDPYVSPAEVETLGLDDLLRRSDVISLHARATPDNQKMIGAPQLALMRSGSFVINTARESLIDEDALLAALRSGHLGGAALDVVDRPSGTARHPLLDLPNVIVTPHIGGATHETLNRGAGMVAAAIGDHMAGRPPAWLVNPQVIRGAGS